MAASAPSLQANLYDSSSKLCFIRSDRLKWRSFSCKRKGHPALIIKSVLNNKHSSINGDETVEPARLLLERLFAQTQKLEEKIGKDLNLPEDVELELDLEMLGSDLQTALSVLKKKEEDLEAAENKILSEYRDLEEAKEELSRREEAISDASLRQEKLENELKQANLELASHAAEIEDLKLRLEKRDNEMTAARSALLLKENEMLFMIDELKRKTEEATKTESELRSKSRVLLETDEILSKQAAEIEDLRKSVHAKDEELKISAMLLESEEEKLKAVEANLEKQTMDWLVAQEEWKKLAEEAFKVNETLEDFTRVKALLCDVRSELVSSQKALTLSRRKMEDQQALLEKQLVELEEHRKSLSSYTESLGDADVEIESERVKLRLAEAQKQELERDLFVEKDLIDELKRRLNDQKLSLQQATGEISGLRDELEFRKLEFGKLQNVLERKESELVEAKLAIRHLNSEQAAVKIMLNERESEQLDALLKLGEVNQEVLNLKSLLSRRDTELTETTTMLKSKEEQVETIRHDLNNTKTKYSEATIVVKRIVDLTNKFVTSINKPIEHEPSFDFEKKQLETEMESIRETLRSREMEVLASRRALTIKDNELKMALEKLEERDKEMNEMKQELTRDADDLRRLYAMAQERIGERSIGELAIEKLELEAAQLEVEAATSALEKITEMSRELLRTTSLSVEADYDLGISTRDGCFDELKTEVARLSDLTEKMVREAGIEADSGVDFG